MKITRSADSYLLALTEITVINDTLDLFATHLKIYCKIDLMPFKIARR